MTATFRAETTPILVIRDERERTLQYLSALVAWSRATRIRRIVFVENSNTNFDFGPVARMLEDAGKELELLIFDGNKDVEQYGKGYGEGEILEHAFRHSRLLRASPDFYKVTGRLFVRNFDKVSEATTYSEAFRLKAKEGRAPKAVTTFYKCSVELFEARLLDSYRNVTDEEGHRIEQAYYYQLANLGIRDFAVKPRIVGHSASTGKIYEEYDPEIIRTAHLLLGTAVHTAP